MKKIFAILLFVFVMTGCVFAKTQTQNQIKFDGKTYTLKFAEKSKLTDGYVNEYYKSSEKYSNWTEIMGVYHYPNYSSPIQLVSQFEKQLKQKGLSSTVFLNDKEGRAGIVFMVAGKGPSEFLEYNIFKYEKYKGNQVIALQYARRFMVNKNTDLSKIANEIEGSQKRLINAITSAEIPQIVEQDFNLGK